MSPRPFERPATIALPESEVPTPGASLDGLWLSARGEDGARGGAVVAPPHPLMGGSMGSPVSTEIALAASDVGLASLRFDWRGVGGSAGSPSGEVADADSDYRAALEFMQESVDGPIAACGYSWGALAALRVGAASARARRLVLVAPPVAMIAADLLAAFGRPVLVVAGDRDEYVPVDPLHELLDPLEAAELVVLEGVDHFFMAGLGDLGRCVREWLEGGR